jgi:hypothetical protein
MRGALILIGSLGVLAAAAWPQATAPQTATRSPAADGSRTDASNRFVGTWKLVSIERIDTNGAVLPPAAPPAVGSPNATGYLVYDAAGYMGLTIAQSGRKPFAGSRPTPDEAKPALLGYSAYCGTFRVNDAARTVTHRIEAGLNPGHTGTEQTSAFEISDRRLALVSPRTAEGQMRWTWEREPNLATLTPLHHRLIGFWKQVGTERRRFDGTVMRTEPPRAGYLIFSAAGHMAVHLIDPGRKPYGAADPTPAEAQQALTTYASYFGPYEVNDRESYEVTRQIGAISPPLTGQLALRRLEFVGDNRVILKPPPGILDGQLVQGYVTWERVTPPVGPAR